MGTKSDRKAAKAHRGRLKRQAGYSAKDRDRVAASGAPQRDHVAAAVLYVVFQRWSGGCPTASKILGRALRTLVGDGYERDPTQARMVVMSRQPRPRLKPPKPKRQDI